MNNKIKKLHRHVTAIMGTSLLALPLVQAEEVMPEQATDIERIEITGSRISRTDMEGANPVTVIDEAQIQKLNFSNAGDLLQNLTVSAGMATNTQTNRGGDSTVRFSLRGIGSQRTLVLLNGRRVVAGGAGANSSVDLNTIPTAIIKRIEVLKDGASAVYGSDAIAGVVNIITRDDYEGFQFTLQHAQTSRSDAKTTGLDLVYGTSSNNSNTVFSVGMNDQGTAWLGDRENSEYELFFTGPTDSFQGGSSAVPWTLATTPDGARTRGPDYGGWIPYDGTIHAYNYNPVNYLQTPSKRRYANVQSTYDFPNTNSFFGDLRAFGSMGYVETEGHQLVAPEPLAPLVFFGTQAPYSPRNYYNATQGPKDADGNPYTLLDWRRRVLETGGRHSYRSFNTFRSVVGLSGVLPNDWLWEIAYNYGRSNSVIRAEGYFNLARVAEAVGPTGWLDTSGQLLLDDANNPAVAPGSAGVTLVCLDASNQIIPGCVPLNIFGQPGTDSAVSEDMLGYISRQYNTTSTGMNRQEELTFTLSGELLELPAGPLAFATGAEYRKVQGSYTPDSLILSGTTTAGSAVGTDGGYDVTEYYAEINVPLLRDASLAYRLELDAALRHSRYSSFGNNSSGKVGIRWMPHADLMIRATASEAFRAPSTSELFGGAATGYPTVQDPCEVLEVNQNCIANGVPPEGYTFGAAQLATQFGGAANWGDSVTLTPETANIVTAGLVYTPSFASGLSMTLDYWKIDLKSAISSVGAQARLDGCYYRGEYCSSIKRFGADSGVHGIIQSIQDFTLNVGGLSTSGIDFNLSYPIRTDSWGLFKLELDSSYLLKYQKELAGNDLINHKGRHWENHDGHFATWRSNLTLDWSYQRLDAGLRFRYIDSVQEEVVGWWTGGVPFERKIASVFYMDVTAAYQINAVTSIRLGINNLLDRAAPLSGSASDANAITQVYDVLGRRGYLRLDLQF